MGSMNVPTDFALLFAPMSQLWNPQIRKDNNIELIGNFSIGDFFFVTPFLLPEALVEACRLVPDHR